jgi:hypothetical protein
MLAHMQDVSTNSDNFNMICCLSSSTAIPVIFLFSSLQANRVHQLCSSIPKPFNEIVSLHLRSLVASHLQEHAKAIELETQAADQLYTAMEADRDSNWLLAPINVIARQLRLCSYAADALLVRQGQKARHMIEAQDLLKRFLQRMVRRYNT